MDEATAQALVRLWMGREGDAAEIRAMMDQSRRAADLALPVAGDAFATEPSHFDRLLRHEARR